MNLDDLICRQPQPVAWQEGDNIPWSEPGFSARMLREHLAQEHDAASRRQALVDRHVAWIHNTLLESRPARILDLGCGPGFYASRLARLGHRCTGIDYSPASIAYARARATEEQLACTYIEKDLRKANFGDNQYEFVMLLYGEFNIFRPIHIRKILEKANRALVESGTLLLEPHTFDAVRAIGQRANTWYTASTGLFGEEAHLVLTENYWNPADRTATVRHYRVDAGGCRVTAFAQSFQAYTDDDYRDMLSECGFSKIQIWPTLGGVQEFAGELVAISAEKI